MMHVGYQIGPDCQIQSLLYEKLLSRVLYGGILNFGASEEDAFEYRFTPNSHVIDQCLTESEIVETGGSKFRVNIFNF